MLGSGGPPGVVEFETFIAKVGFAVGAALGGLQGLRRLAESAHDGDAAQTQRVPVPDRDQNTSLSYCVCVCV